MHKTRLDLVPVSLLTYPVVASVWAELLVVLLDDTACGFHCEYIGSIVIVMESKENGRNISGIINHCGYALRTTFCL